MVNVTDQLGREVSLMQPPLHIITTVPSQTELLFYLGLDNQIAGVTKFCIHPSDKVKGKLQIGGTKQLNIPLIHFMKPDLIIANKEENDRTQIEGLMANYPVYISDPSDLAGALQMLNDIGILTDRLMPATALVSKINEQFLILKSLQLPTLRVAYLIWQRPYMVAGNTTFIDDMLRRCGFINAFAQQRYPEVTAVMLKNAKPDIVLLSSEPYPFKQKHAEEFARLLPNAIIKIVDGELFSWYGSRLLLSPKYFIALTDSIKQALNGK